MDSDDEGRDLTTGPSVLSSSWGYGVRKVQTPVVRLRTGPTVLDVRLLKEWRTRRPVSSLGHPTSTLFRGGRTRPLTPPGGSG